MGTVIHLGLACSRESKRGEGLVISPLARHIACLQTMVKLIRSLIHNYA